MAKSTSFPRALVQDLLLEGQAESYCGGAPVAGRVGGYPQGMRIGKIAVDGSQEGTNDRSCIMPTNHFKDGPLAPNP